jgi:S1-C subfamily serine protease
MTHFRRFPALALIALLALAGSPNTSAAPPRSTAPTTAPQNVLLEFQASWCGACQAARPMVERVKTQGYPVRVIDVDQNAALAQRFQITGVPTFVVIVGGRQVDRNVGVPDEGRWQQLLRPLASARSSASQARVPARKTASPRAAAPARSHQAQPDGVSSADTATVRPVSYGAAIARADVAQTDLRVVPSVRPLASAQPAVEPLDASVRISVAEPGGRAIGSGTIIASRPGEAIVVTCGHLFRDSGGRGRIQVDLFHDGRPQSYAGELISYNEQADVGLVRITPQDLLPAIPVAPRGYDLHPGAEITDVGCGGGAPPTVKEGRITAINRYMGPANIECTGMPVQGRSGGGLFSDDGYVIGVCNAADPSEGKGLYAGLEAIQNELDKQHLAVLYNRPAAASRLADAGSQASGAAEPVTVPRTDAGESLADVLANVGEAEVVCVVRPLKDPRARSRVIMLDRASRDFLIQLAREQGVQQSRHLTSLKVGANRGATLSKFPKLPRPTLHPVLRVHNRHTEN